MLSTLRHVVRVARHAIDQRINASKRSSKWPTVEKHWLAGHPTCAACGLKDQLNVHHKKPFHLDPSLELDETNLITLCMAKDNHCHLLLGHGDNFKAFNPDVEADVKEAAFFFMKKDRSALTSLWAQAKNKRKMQL